MCHYQPIYAAYESFRLHRRLLAFGSDRQTSTARLHTTARAHSFTATSLQPPTSCRKICAHYRGEELAPELAYCATGSSKSHRNVRLPDQNRPCRPCATAFRDALDGFVPITYGSPAVPSLRIGSSPERTVLGATRVALRAAAVWKKDLDPSAQRIHRPFARSSQPAASRGRSGQ